MNNEKALQIIAENRESYNAIALDFDVTRHYAWPEFELLKSYIKKGDKILDVGCGNGRLYKFLISDFKFQIFYTGIDQSEELIKIAKKHPDYRLRRNDSHKFLVADVFNLPFKDRELDIVAGIAFLHHIPSEELRIKVLKEIYRVLKPGGILFLSNWNLWRWEIISHNVKRNKMNPSHFFFPHGGMDAGDFWIPFHSPRHSRPVSQYGINSGGNPALRYYHHFKKRELAALAKKTGFKIVFYKKGRNISTVLQK